MASAVPNATCRIAPCGSRRSAVTPTARLCGEARSDSHVVSAGSIGPATRTGPVGSRRRASAVNGADPSLSRQPWIRVSPSAGMPSAGNRHGLPAARVVRVCPADGQHGAGRERLPALKRSHLQRGVEIRPRRDESVERDAGPPPGLPRCGSASTGRPGRSRRGRWHGDERDDQRRRRRGAGQVDEREAREHRAAPGQALCSLQDRPGGAKRQHPDGQTAQRREQQRHRVIACRRSSASAATRADAAATASTSISLALRSQHQRAEQHGHRQPPDAQRDHPGRGDHAVRQDRARWFSFAAAPAARRRRFPRPRRRSVPRAHSHPDSAATNRTQWPVRAPALRSRSSSAR